MIITRTPFRISFVGGGTDLAAFYTRHPGAVLSTSIDKYMYISLHPYFEEKMIHLKYSKTETVQDYSEIRHRIFRQLLESMQINGVEISSSADVPSGTGLGSSSTFTVGLYHCLSAYQGIFRSKQDLGRYACDVEIEQLGEPIGKQDQYAAAFGGLNVIRFLTDGRVTVEPLLVPKEKRQQLEKNCLMFYLGGTRDASSILSQQKENTIAEGDKFELLKKMAAQVDQLRAALEMGSLDDLGLALDEGWQMKKSLAKGISNPRIDQFYDLAKQNGALGGKLLGAGGSGFLLLYCPQEKQPALRQALKELKELKFCFEQTGSTIIFFND